MQNELVLAPCPLPTWKLAACAFLHNVCYGVGQKVLQLRWSVSRSPRMTVALASFLFTPHVLPSVSFGLEFIVDCSSSLRRLNLIFRIWFALSWDGQRVLQTQKPSGNWAGQMQNACRMVVHSLSLAVFCPCVPPLVLQCPAQVSRSAGAAKVPRRFGAGHSSAAWTY